MTLQNINLFTPIGIWFHVEIFVLPIYHLVNHYYSHGHLSLKHDLTPRKKVESNIKFGSRKELAD